MRTLKCVGLSLYPDLRDRLVLFGPEADDVKTEIKTDDVSHQQLFGVYLTSVLLGRTGSGK